MFVPNDLFIVYANGYEGCGGKSMSIVRNINVKK